MRGFYKLYALVIPKINVVCFKWNSTENKLKEHILASLTEMILKSEESDSSQTTRNE